MKQLFVQTALLVLCLSVPAAAGSLAVSPTQLTVGPSSSTATLQVRAKGSDTTAGQVRVLRWVQQDGVNKLLPTRDVVASPPALRLEPGKEMTVRIVRTVKAPVAGEECYRVLVDQLPGAEQDKTVVKFAIRHSVPLCFDSAKQRPGEVSWTLQRDGGKVFLAATNAGERRAVARNLKITGARKASAEMGSAVVLGSSTMGWPLKGALKGFTPGSGFSLSATINGKDVQFTGKVGGR